MISKIIDCEWKNFPFNYIEFRSSVHCQRLLYYLGMIEPDMIPSSFLHGIDHAERVAFYCAIIAWYRGLKEDITNTLIVAGLLHDIGRTNDFHDPSHGIKSAEKLQAGEYDRLLSTIPDRTMLLELVKAHCDMSLGPGNAANYLLVLKDSDALDRVRLGNSFIMLFTNEAKQLKEFAAEVYSKYEEKKADPIYYHITKLRNVPSIMATGLKRPPKKRPILRSNS